MSPHDLLLDESFGQLDEARRAPLDQALTADPALAARRSSLTRRLELLLDDGDDRPGLEPPEGLAARTLELIRRRREAPETLEFTPARPRFRWADLAAAAAVLLVGLSALVPAVQHQRAQANRLACSNNLRQVGLALNQYAATHESYPYVTSSCPANYVGAAFVLLHEEGLLKDPSVLDCPCNGCSENRGEFPPFDDLRQKETRLQGACRDAVGWEYAYHLGYRDGSGTPGPIPVDSGPYVALLADQPPFAIDDGDGHAGSILDGNSPNHAGRGQNVLFADGRVDWRRSRWISNEDTDLYLNQFARLAPGTRPEDAVLTPTVLRFGD